MIPGVCGRTAHLGSLSIVNVSLSAVVQLGDHGNYTPRVRAIAVQRQVDHTLGGEAEFAAYPIFWRPFPNLSAPAVCLTKEQVCERIHVGSISVIGVGSSSLLQAGNGSCMQAESRIKHIRQFQAPLQAPAGPV
ncbi:spore germination protein GerPE [Paenibacillus daejeonensis]|uniref:spore germination protein GerPE n=1 Tax=Paenibacillus daejeonensis TaxID=135193 RepID=UPI00035CAB42|nr:spore germination protein GerPE [Paenibacillus daejeonensis]